jgi:hypothetical protein
VEGKNNKAKETLKIYSRPVEMYIVVFEMEPSVI